jgi:cytoskeletal protein CcmA (bactofilin family)
MTSANPVLDPQALVNPDPSSGQTDAAFSGQRSTESAVKPLSPMMLVQPPDQQQGRAKLFSPEAHTDIERFIQNLDVDKVLLIPAGVTISSDLLTNGNAAVIAGRVEGSIDSGAGPIIIKEGGEVIGTVTSDEYVVVAGKVTAASPDGNAILTKGLWVLAATGSVKGTVAYGRQRAYEGGVLNGRAVPFSEYQPRH